ncbi:hypothetical protein [Pararcticibacter amylolyticus]|nr:hypothetical protein [Pararcticibacter amylolyticus]
MMTMSASSVVPNPKIPSYVPPSPQAQALTRYGDYPVDYHTGLVDMTVPVYEIITKEFRLPIEMKFHASGRLAYEANGILGMRWTLNCGGVITRSLKGRPDEWSYLTNHAFNPANGTPSYEELYNSCVEGYRNTDYVHNTKYDSEYDIFSFVLPNGKSGKFIMKEENGTKKPMLIPYQAIKIEPIANPANNGIYDAIRITDTDGKEYYYTGTFTFGSSELPHEGIYGSIWSSWDLSYMVSAGKTDTVKFTYQRSESPYQHYTERTSTGDNLRDYSTSANFHQYDYTGPEVMYMLSTNNVKDDWFDNHGARLSSVLSSISFNGGTVNFFYRSNGYHDSFLDRIEVTGPGGSGLRKVKFNTSKSSGESELEYLRSIEFCGQEGLVEEKYSFDYFEPPVSGVGTGLGYKDWWGYYTWNTGNNSHLIPVRDVWLNVADQGNTSSVLKPVGYQAVNRDAHTESKKVGMLKSIQYPTGGRTEFDYEGNYYDMTIYTPQNGAKTEGPGLRIKQVKKIPVNGPATVSTFKYGYYEDGRGYIAPALRAGAHLTEEYVMYLSWDYPLYFNSDGNVTFTGDEHAAYRIMDYLSDPAFDYSIWGNNYISYDYVTEYTGTENAPLMKTVYNYSLKDYKTNAFTISDRIGTPVEKVYADPADIWMGGKLLEKTSYKQNSSGVFTEKTIRDTYSYQSFTKGTAWDMPVYRHVLMGINRPYTKQYNNPGELERLYYNTEKDYHDNSCNVYGYGFRKYTSGEEKVMQHVSQVFNADGTAFTKIKNYTYDPGYLLTKSEEVINSGQVSEKQTFNYSFDDISKPVYSTMTDKNILDQVIQTDYYKDGKLLFTQKTNYGYWGSNLYAPADITTQKAGGESETRIIFHKYDDRGNVNCLSMANGPKISYLYSYNGRYPIVKVENAEYSVLENVLGAAAIKSFQRRDNPTDEQINTFIAPLRATLKEASINSYTYRPMIGLTSETSGSDLTTRYEYDNFQRLWRIKDQNGKVLKEYNYHFKQ